MNELMASPTLRRLRERMLALYGPGMADQCMERLSCLLGRYGVSPESQFSAPPWTQADRVIITYGDMVRAENGPPLGALFQFLTDRLGDAINTVHVLPFFPYSSDDGFSVIDHRRVDPDLGIWEDVELLGGQFRLMVDLVLNHVSRSSDWFSDYVCGIAPARGYFVEASPQEDLSAVVRPRISPLLSEVHCLDATRHVWTTFSEDQIDLNYANPDVLFEMMDILLWYVSKGASIIRLDAIAYLWKQIGTPCIHLKETHEIVRVFRDVLSLTAPNVLLLSETNVPHAENVSYFGQGNEAHMVYQFTLPPLLIHALQTGDGRYLTRWASELETPPSGCTFLNFTASHDGIGVRPLEGIVPERDVAAMMERIRRSGGQVSTRKGAGGERPYELNVAYIDALSEPLDDDDRLAAKFLCSQTVALGLAGVPAVYFNSLFGARNDLDGVARTGRARAINRRKWRMSELDAMLDDDTGLAAKIFGAYARRLKVRGEQPAFHPDGRQEVLDLGGRLFAFVRTAPGEEQKIVCLHNLCGERVKADAAVVARALGSQSCMDLLSYHTGGPRRQPINPGGTLALEPYQCCWLSARQ